jgi:myo-inositol-1(or 4)-monophosphatase
MSKEHAEWLGVAKNLAITAGRLVIEARQNSVFVRDYKADHELVTATDLAVDQYLCSSVAERYPSHRILSEESSPNMYFV